MRPRLISAVFMLCGAFAMIFGVCSVATPQTASAMPALQPSPRPTLAPTTPPEPTATTEAPQATTVAPETNEDADDNDGPAPTPAPAGRVTGTVIDLRTGAPVPGVLVQVGDMLVMSDAYGNYERKPLASGMYNVGLQLRLDEGISGQPMQEIAVGQGDNVMVHLFFTSPAPVVVAQPTAPPADTPVPPEPTAVPNDQVAPTTVPAMENAAEEIGQRAAQIQVDAAPNQPVASAAMQPALLPRTSMPTQVALPWLWLWLGAALLGCGVGIYAYTMRQQRAAVQRQSVADQFVLDQLMGVQLTPAKQPVNDDQVLEQLLDRRPR